MRMGKSEQETALTRERIVKAAASEFRQHGIVATGLADLMSAAGLTHGGFYRQFDSKDQLVAEASAVASAAPTEQFAPAPSGAPAAKWLADGASSYLSTTRHTHHQP